MPVISVYAYEEGRTIVKRTFFTKGFRKYKNSNETFEKNIDEQYKESVCRKLPASGKTGNTDMNYCFG